MPNPQPKDSLALDVIDPLGLLQKSLLYSVDAKYELCSSSEPVSAFAPSIVPSVSRASLSHLLAPFLLVYLVNSLVYFVNSLAFPLRQYSKFYSFSSASSALNSVVRPLPAVFDEPRCQKTAKARRKSSSDRPLEIRRHEFLA